MFSFHSSSDQGSEFKLGCLKVEYYKSSLHGILKNIIRKTEENNFKTPPQTQTNHLSTPRHIHTGTYIHTFILRASSKKEGYAQAKRKHFIFSLQSKTCLPSFKFLLYKWPHLLITDILVRKHYIFSEQWSRAMVPRKPMQCPSSVCNPKPRTWDNTRYYVPPCVELKLRSVKLTLFPC